MAMADPALWGRTRLPAPETTVLGQPPGASFARRGWSCRLRTGTIGRRRRAATPGKADFDQDAAG